MRLNTTQDPCYEIASPEHKKRVLSLTVAFCTRSLDAISLFKSHLRHWWPRACTCCLTTAALPSFALACPMQCFSLRRAAPSLVDVTSFLVRRSSSHRREPWCRCGVALADPKALSAKPDRADQYSSTHSHKLTGVTAMPAQSSSRLLCQRRSRHNYGDATGQWAVWHTGTAFVRNLLLRSWSCTGFGQ